MIPIIVGAVVGAVAGFERWNNYSSLKKFKAEVPEGLKKNITLLMESEVDFGKGVVFNEKAVDKFLEALVFYKPFLNDKAAKPARVILEKRYFFEASSKDPAACLDFDTALLDLLKSL